MPAVVARLAAALPEDFGPLVVEQRPRTVSRDGEMIEIDDSTLFAAAADRRRRG